MKDIARWLSLLSALFFAGCQSPTIPNPNDPTDAEQATPEAMTATLKQASDFLNERVEKGEINDARAQQLLATTADKLVRRVDVRHMDPLSAWKYGDVFRTAKRWDLAKQTYELAVAHAKNEDRRVNDTLRLAVCLANLGDVKGALQTAAKTLNAGPHDSAPILPSVLYELTPAAQGKNHDIELASLIESAVAKHLATIVDRKSIAGASFENAKSHHVQAAWDKIVELYRAAGRDDLAAAAFAKGNKAVRQLPPTIYRPLR